MVAGKSFDRSHDPLLGTAYETRSFLGEGAMGLVLAAEHVALGTSVVVKLLHVDLARQPDFVDRMRIEAQAMSRLQSPHLTRCTDLSMTPDGRPFLVLERLHGRTVADEIAARGSLPVAEAIDIARQTLAGLSVVHRAGIVHRDIKPANLFLAESEGRRILKILDFGIAKVVSPSGDGTTPRPLSFPTAEGTTIGSPRCLSPEQAKGLSIDARTDIYAVGVLLYTLLTGRGPFHAFRGVLAVMQAHVLIVPDPPSSCAPQRIPPEIDALVMRALAKRPEDRFGSAEELSAALARITPTETGSTFDTQPLVYEAVVDDAAPTIVRPQTRDTVPHRAEAETLLPPKPQAMDRPRSPSPGRIRAELRAVGAVQLIALCVIVLATATALTARLWALM